MLQEVRPVGHVQEGGVSRTRQVGALACEISGKAGGIAGGGNGCSHAASGEKYSKAASWRLRRAISVAKSTKLGHNATMGRANANDTAEQRIKR